MANGQVSLRAAPLHYFHVADCGMDLGGIISRRYSRWRSTAEEDLCTARLGLTKGKAPPREREKGQQASQRQNGSKSHAAGISPTWKWIIMGHLQKMEFAKNHLNRSKILCQKVRSEQARALRNSIMF